MKVLVTGAGPTGFLGKHVREALSNMYVTFVGSTDYDLTDYMQTWRMILNEEPDVIVHMAAVCGGILANKNSPADFLAKNTAMNLNIYNAAKNATKWYLAFTR